MTRGRPERGSAVESHGPLGLLGERIHEEVWDPSECPARAELLDVLRDDTDRSGSDR